ncbi:MAG: hypothetical protein A3H93_14675 [Rhodocyclales bacterium RIFCSPLOWO2_02_FULL_63_24]|nr:MAG: hypothetical protein A2040_07395 [Rhodocyclales bacterium GWA2_65_19]OHC71247.1 MAG: hypothetical protein A3H93_14675 [Rhodocyclales bacterium RIFCSPLOWO2_02_FULL_63_24]
MLKLSRFLLLGAAAALLSGCVKFYIAGHTEDFADYISGEGEGDPFTGYGTSTIEFAKLKIRCSGPYQPDGRNRGARGTVTCSDGRRIELVSRLSSMDTGDGNGTDNFGHRGRFVFSTNEAYVEREGERYRDEVARRNLDVAHLRVAAASSVAAAPVSAPRQSAAAAEATAAAVAVAPAPTPALNAAPGGAPGMAAAEANLRPVPAPAMPQGEGKLALVVGNSNYPGAPLKNPVADARAIAAKFRALGFEVLHGENLSQRGMTRLVTRFGERLPGRQVGVFYYAGHGMQVRGRNYLIPIDAQITSEASARSESIDVDQVLDHLATSGSGVNLVVLDACRNNPFERRFRSTAGGLAQLDAPKGTLIAFATAPGKVAFDGEGVHGTYTSALLRVLDEPGLNIESVFKRVRTEVSRITGDQQIPWEASSLTGEFYFVPGRVAAEAPRAADTEMLFWQSIKDSRDADDFTAYLKRYPDGAFADIARNRLRKAKPN